MKPTDWNTERFKGNEVVSVRHCPPIPGAPAVFDSIFEPRIAVRDPGVYALFFEERLIYIGKYQGPRKDAFAGDVVSHRWRKHLATITCRGKNVTLNPTPFSTCLEKIREKKYRSTSLGKGFLNCERAVVTKDRSCVSSVSRVMFALDNWACFGKDLEKALPKFEFVYFSIRKSQSTNTAKCRKLVTQLEAELIKRCQPSLNVLGVRGTRRQMSVVLIDKYLFLLSTYTQAGPPSAAPSDSNADITTRLFGIKDAHTNLAKDFQKLWKWLETEADLEYYFTKTPDFRIAMRDPGRKRPKVVATIQWRSRKQALVLRYGVALSRLQLNHRVLKGTTLPIEMNITSGPSRVRLLAVIQLVLETFRTKEK